jgi:hypothetical protein
MRKIGGINFVAGREFLIGLFVVKQAEPNLADIVKALGPARTGPGGLDSRQQEGRENTNDGDHDQELDERECVRWLA